MTNNVAPSRRPGRRPSMKEVADRAGVAMSSVSRCLSGHPDVSERMRANVMEAVRELGYRPDLLAQGLRSQRTMSAGFVVSDITNPVLAAAITGAEHRLRTAGYSLLLTGSDGLAELDADSIRSLDQRRVDGFLLSLTDEQDAATAEAIRELDAPVLLLDRDLPNGVDAPRVCFDHYSGMHAAAQQLIALGHTDVALIQGGPRRPARQRRAGVEDALAAGSGSTSVYEGDFSIEHGYAATLAILDASPRPTAIIAAGNILMHGALRALRDRSVRVGRDISFVGCDDVAVAEFHDPPIAVVRRDNVAIGETAAESLLAMLDGTWPIDDITLPTEFVMRPSCAAPAR